jgi:uncharacterized protein (DUF433 family)
MSTMIEIGSLIESVPDVYGGRPCLARSGFPIIQLVADYQAGMRAADFLEAYTHIDEESIYAGLAYYLANKEALDAELEERNREAAELYEEWQEEQWRAAR